MTDGSTSRHRWGWALILLGALLVVVGAVGVVNPFGLVWVARLLDHPYPMGVAAALLVTVGIRLRLDRVLTRLALGSICLAAGLGWGAAWLVSPGEDGAVATSPAPDRAEYEAVVREAGSDDEPAWRVSVRQTGSLLAREWPVGCAKSGLPEEAFDRVRWAGPDLLVVELGERSLQVDVDPATGRPQRGTGPGWTRC
ncbi:MULTISPECIES: hypothetical protein [unclassified Nocardioides]|uniref:hypothetical protein n=1 Tax=unclassified Nocardioides TaxID=2615069 RepID=UPI003014C510